MEGVTCMFGWRCFLGRALFWGRNFDLADSWVECFYFILFYFAFAEGVRSRCREGVTFPRIESASMLA